MLFLSVEKSNFLLIPTIWTTSNLYAWHILFVHSPNKFNPIETFLQSGALLEKYNCLDLVKLSTLTKSIPPMRPPFTLPPNWTLNISPSLISAKLNLLKGKENPLDIYNIYIIGSFSNTPLSISNSKVSLGDVLSNMSSSKARR